MSIGSGWQIKANKTAKNRRAVYQNFSSVKLPKNAITEDEFLGLHGVSSPISTYMLDKMRSNRMLRTQRGKERFEREAAAAEAAYREKREKVKTEYRKLLDSGVVRDKTRIEKLLTTAQGHSDNDAVQAARRALDKRGIDWKTGKKRKK